jgi:citrate lyase subunit beta / citryl-CoA lyase
MGFSGKSVIHPDQLADVHDVFTPTEDEVAWAKKVIAAFEAAQARGEAALALEGEFIDPAVVGRARGLLAVAGGTERGRA